MPAVLAGGNELRPGCEEMDRRVLQAAGGADARVVFLPAAVARYDPHGSERGAVSYWNRLGAPCEVALILSRQDADRPEWVAMIERATLVYLGGDPDVLLKALRVYERGGVAGGSSVGAMVTRVHSQRISLYAARLRLAGLLHDVGKIGVPAAILTKPGALTEDERALFRTHPAIGEHMLGTVPFLHPILPAVRHHHERWDGHSYPDGLAGEAIPRDAAILMVADSFDARPVRGPTGRRAPWGRRAGGLREGSGARWSCRPASQPCCAGCWRGGRPRSGARPTPSPAAAGKGARRAIERAALSLFPLSSMAQQ